MEGERTFTRRHHPDCKEGWIRNRGVTRRNILDVYNFYYKKLCVFKRYLRVTPRFSLIVKINTCGVTDTLLY